MPSLLGAQLVKKQRMEHKRKKNRAHEHHPEKRDCSHFKHTRCEAPQPISTKTKHALERPHIGLKDIQTIGMGGEGKGVYGCVPKRCRYISEICGACRQPSFGERQLP